MPEKFCAYCRTHREDAGFRRVRHPQSNTNRLMCTRCQDKRRRPRAELEALAAQERDARKKGKP